jgi:hypothetical protein
MSEQFLKTYGYCVFSVGTGAKTCSDCGPFTKGSFVIEGAGFCQWKEGLWILQSVLLGIPFAEGWVTDRHELAAVFF